MERIKPFEERFDRYDSWYEKFPGKRLFRWELNCLRNIDPGDKALEIGVGTGRFASELGIKFGIDPAFNPLKIAKQRGILAVCADGRKVPFPENTFSSVFLIVTICFADEPQKLIEESYRILRPGGKIVLGLVPRGSEWGRHYLKLKAEGHFFYKFAEFYTVKEVSSMLVEAGFKNISGYSTIYGPPPEGNEDEVIKEVLDETAGFVCIYAHKPDGSEN